ncbi:MAG TPA: PAS domain S-box protein [Methanoculleus sp.]|nr:PAS domain S-box protein [Methanoculleus sp.]
MSSFPVELPKILEILKANPRGMSVSDIAQELGANRNTVSRYLDMLLISGEVEMRAYGKAKVFFLSQRVPISAMLNFSSDMVIVLDQDLRVVQVNTPVCEFLGATRDEILTTTLRESPLVMFDHPVIIEKIRDAMAGREIAENLRFLRVDEELFFRFKIVSTVFNDGSPGVTLILEDITEQQTAEEALRKSESTYRTLVEEINDIIWDIDEESRFTFVSPRVREVLGYSPEEMLGKPIRDFMDDAGEAPQLFSPGAQAPGESSYAEYDIRHKDGRPVPMETSWRLILDEIGEPAGFRLVSRDITERKQAMGRVRQWKSFLHSIVQNIPAVVLVREMGEGRYVFVNRMAETLFGVTRQDAGGLRGDEIFSPALAAVLAEGDDEVANTASATDIAEKELALPACGTKPFHLRKIPIFSQAGGIKYILTIAEDITGQKRVEEQILAERDRAESYLDSAGVMIAVVDAGGRISRMNRKGCAILGYGEDELLGQEWFSTLIPDRLRDELRANFRRFISGDGQQSEDEVGTVITRTGEERTIRWHNTLLRDADGRIVAMVSAGDDITGHAA